MIFTETRLKGAFVVDLERHEDERGFFARRFCRREFEARGLKPVIAQSGLARNRKKGTLRGMHFQLPPAAETKLGLEWPLPVAVISQRDRGFQPLAEIEPELRQRMALPPRRQRPGQRQETRIAV